MISEPYSSNNQSMYANGNEPTDQNLRLQNLQEPDGSAVLTVSNSQQEHERQANF